MRRECRQYFQRHRWLAISAYTRHARVHYLTKGPWASCQIAVTYVPLCMPAKITSGFLLSRWWGKRSWHSRHMRTPQFYVSIFFKVKLGFVMLTVRGKRHSFSTHERILLWKHQSFWDRKCLDLRGTRTLQPSDSCRMLDQFKLLGPDICCPMFILILVIFVKYSQHSKY